VLALLRSSRVGSMSGTKGLPSSPRLPRPSKPACLPPNLPKSPLPRSPRPRKPSPGAPRPLGGPPSPRPCTTSNSRFDSLSAVLMRDLALGLFNGRSV